MSCSASFTAPWLLTLPQPSFTRGKRSPGFALEHKSAGAVAHAGHKTFPWGGPEQGNPALEGGIKAAGLRGAVAHQETICNPQEQWLYSLLYLDFAEFQV